MLLGVPCVAADVGGISSIFENGKDGILYEVGNVETLAKSVNRIFENPDETEMFRKNAREHALVTHNPDENFKRLLEIYREIV